MGRKSPWLRRLDEIRSISFEPIAADVNMARLKRLRAASEKPVKQLPAKDRASAKRMRATLIALHELLQSERRWVCKMEEIAAQMGDGTSAATARRGIRELEDASLIEVVRIKRDNRHGGQGPSQYMISWASIRDLALQQGLQPSLFDGADVDAGQDDQPDLVPGEARRPAELAGQDHPDREPDSTGSGELSAGEQAPSQNARAPSQNARAPSQNARAPSHFGRAPSQNERANIDARARSPLPIPITYPPPPSSGDGFGIAYVRPSKPAARGSTSPEEEEEALWRTVSEQLAGIGIADRRATIVAAARRGWRPQQALDVIAQWQRKSIRLPDGSQIHAWRPGAVWWQLRNTDPGTPIDLPPQPKYAEMLARELQAKRRQRQAVEPAAAQAPCPHCGSRPPHFVHAAGVQCTDCNRLIETPQQGVEVGK